MLSMTPAAGARTSIVTLSVSMSAMTSSTLTASPVRAHTRSRQAAFAPAAAASARAPGFFSTFAMVPSVMDSPMCGTAMSLRRRARVSASRSPKSAERGSEGRTCSRGGSAAARGRRAARGWRQRRAAPTSAPTCARSRARETGAAVAPRVSSAERHAPRASPRGGTAAPARARSTAALTCWPRLLRPRQVRSGAQHSESACWLQRPAAARARTGRITARSRQLRRARARLRRRAPSAPRAGTPAAGETGKASCRTHRGRRDGAHGGRDHLPKRREALEAAHCGARRVQQLS